MVRTSLELTAARSIFDEAIRQAEDGTSGEIVVVIARKAGNYGRYEALFGFLFALSSVAIGWNVLRESLGFVFLTLIVGFVVGQWIAATFPKIVTLFVSEKLRRQESERSAAFCYRRYKVARTEKATGVLIFIAEVERTVVVLGDASISDKVSLEEWQLVRDQVLRGFREKRPVEGIAAGIEGAGNLLRRHLPSDGAGNEISDRVFFI